MSQYNSQGKAKEQSWMWLHTQQLHGGVIGMNKGQSDYKYELISCYRDNLSRQSSEGQAQLELENLQKLSKVKCLNSKVDYIKPFKTNHIILQGNSNKVPGQLDMQPISQTPTSLQPEPQPTASSVNQISTVPQPDTQTDNMDIEPVNNSDITSLTSRVEHMPTSTSANSQNLHLANTLTQLNPVSSDPEHSTSSVSELEDTTKALRAAINLHVQQRKRKANPDFVSAQPAKKSK